ncbi:MAG: Porphobilinogen deaminase [Thermoleophilia bacterium]|nr:Porphobilinogen deaminase [Thermoleophilia bacterium]
MSEDRPALRLGTRRSPLALAQARLARAALQASDPTLSVELVEMTSDGDVDMRDLRVIGERGIFAHTLERALLDGTIDAAVHSSKDLALEDTPGLVLAAWLEREDPRDALVGADADLLELPQGVHLATGSARRSASIRTLRADLTTSPIRGNVQTRIATARERGDAGCVLAMAGLNRLGITDGAECSVRPIPVTQLVPEAGQGAVVIQAREHVCARTGFAYAAIDHVATRRSVQLERALARHLGGGCERPVGVHVELDALRVHAFFAPSPDDAGTRIEHDVMGLELGTLMSVSAGADVDDAADWTATRLAPDLANQLGVPG